MLCPAQRIEVECFERGCRIDEYEVGGDAGGSFETSVESDSISNTEGSDIDYGLTGTVDPRINGPLVYGFRK